MSRRNSNGAYRSTPGTRGGRDQFKWEDVKSDKDRESYLGNSIHAGVGRWQKGKDILWYTRDAKPISGNVAEKSIKAGLSEEVLNEMAQMKQMEEDLMNEALGLPKAKRDHSSSSLMSKNCLDESEMKSLLARGSTSGYTDAVGGGMTGERIAGLGAAPVKSHDHIDRVIHTDIEKQIIALKNQVGSNSPSSNSQLENVVSTPSSHGRSLSRSASPSGEKERKKSHKHKHRHHDSKRSENRDGSGRHKKSKKVQSGSADNCEVRDRDGGRERDRERVKDRDRDRERERSNRDGDRERDRDRERGKDRDRNRDRDRERSNHDGDRERDRDRDRDRDRERSNRDEDRGRFWSRHDRDRDRERDRSNHASV